MIFTKMKFTMYRFTRKLELDYCQQYVSSNT